MKQLIVPVAIIVSLIAVFFIIDRKEFSHHDDIQTVQSECSTINRKPTVSVPETKPVTEVKPVAETKPTEAKPAEVKPVETKAAESKPVAQTKPEEKLLPYAVSVLSPEEALLLVQKQETED